MIFVHSLKINQNVYVCAHGAPRALCPLITPIPFTMQWRFHHYFIH